MPFVTARYAVGLYDVMMNSFWTWAGLVMHPETSQNEAIFIISKLKGTKEGG